MSSEIDILRYFIDDICERYDVSICEFKLDRFSNNLQYIKVDFMVSEQIHDVFDTIWYELNMYHKLIGLEKDYLLFICL